MGERPRSDQRPITPEASSPESPDEIPKNLRMAIIEYARGLDLFDRSREIILTVEEKFKRFRIAGYGFLAFQEAESGLTPAAEQDLEHAIACINEYDKPQKPDTITERFMPKEEMSADSWLEALGTSLEDIDEELVPVVQALVTLGKQDRARFYAKRSHQAGRALFELEINHGTARNPYAAAAKWVDGIFQDNAEFMQGELSKREQKKRLDYYKKKNLDTYYTDLLELYELIARAQKARGQDVAPTLEKIENIILLLEGAGEVKYMLSSEHPYESMARAYIHAGNNDKAVATIKKISAPVLRKYGLLSVGELLAEQGYPVDPLIDEAKNIGAEEAKKSEKAVAVWSEGNMWQEIARIEMNRGNFTEAEVLIDKEYSEYNRIELYCTLIEKMHKAGKDYSSPLQKARTHVDALEKDKFQNVPSKYHLLLAETESHLGLDPKDNLAESLRYAHGVAWMDTVRNECILKSAQGHARVAAMYLVKTKNMIGVLSQKAREELLKKALATKDKECEAALTRIQKSHSE